MRRVFEYENVRASVIATAFRDPDEVATRVLAAPGYHQFFVLAAASTQTVDVTWFTVGETPTTTNTKTVRVTMTSQGSGGQAPVITATHVSGNAAWTATVSAVSNVAGSNRYYTATVTVQGFSIEVSVLEA